MIQLDKAETAAVACAVIPVTVILQAVAVPSAAAVQMGMASIVKISVEFETLGILTVVVPPIYENHVVLAL